jgi:hypothetical protein
LFEKKLKANELKPPESAGGITLNDNEKEEEPDEQFEKIKLGWGIQKPLPIQRFYLPGISGRIRVEFSRYVGSASIDQTFIETLEVPRSTQCLTIKSKRLPMRLIQRSGTYGICGRI